MNKLSRILVAVDFTSCSSAALSQAIRIARWNKASLSAIHIVETVIAAEVIDALGPLARQVQQSVVEDARRQWRHMSAGVEGAADVPLEIISDAPRSALARRTHEIGADLLVIGVHGAGPGGHGAGTMATLAVRHAPCKVLLVDDGHKGPFRSILVGVDFSPTSREALEQGVRMAAQDGSALHIAHVASPPWLLSPAITVQATPTLREQYAQAVRARLEEFCRPTSPELTWAKPTFHVIEHRSHGAGLVQAAKAAGADLVIIGVRGHTNFRDLLMGSTAERLLREAPCSVLTVRPVDKH